MTMTTSRVVGCGASLVVARSCTRVAAVRPRDRARDRQAEAGAASRPCIVGAAESVERALCEAVAKAWPLVEHVHLDMPVRALCDDADRAVAMDERILDEVSERLLDPL